MKDETLLPDERSAFEKFMEDYFGNCVDRRRVKNGDGEYMAWDMQVAWIVWKKRAGLQSGNSGQVPAGLRLALSNAGIAAPESDDMLFATHEKYVQLLVDWVKDRKPFAAPAASDGWIPVSERMPPCKTGVLVATEMDGPGDWRMKWATYVPKHPDAINGWLIPGASWTPTHWQPLPDAPKGV